MDINPKYRVSCWKNKNEFEKTYNQIYKSKSNEEILEGYNTLLAWKIRRSQETPAGIQCTIALLDASVKDNEETTLDSFTLNILYSTSLTKFVNFAASFQMGQGTMYKSAYFLGIDSFIIDLRHLCAHGKQTPNLEVFRKSHRYCMEWIENFYWITELNNIKDATIKDIRYDTDFQVILIAIFPLYDTTVKAIHKDITLPEKAEPSFDERLCAVKSLMEKKQLKNLSKALNYLTHMLSIQLESKNMRIYPKTFFHVMIQCCEYFLTIQDVIEYNDDIDASPPTSKRSKYVKESIVNLYMGLIVSIAKNDYLKMFTETLFQISSNTSENELKRKSAQFWITRILDSFQYYKDFCNLDNAIHPILQTAVTEEIREIFDRKLNADLKEVIIFVGTQLLPSTLKYSKEFFLQVFNSVDDQSRSICISLLKLIHPPLTDSQKGFLENMINIKTGYNRMSQQSKSDKIYSISDLFLPSEHRKSMIHDEIAPAGEEECIWRASTAEIDWKTVGFGTEFAI